jgi:hypothetical protein
MDIETKSDSANKRMNSLVAVTVVILSVFTAVSKIKDDNIVQAIQTAKADSVDSWNEYQAARMKLRIVEAANQTIRLTANLPGLDAEAVATERKRNDEAIAGYDASSKTLFGKAKGLEASIEKLNFQDDQFDISDALISIAIAAAAVAALTESWMLLCLAWVSGGTGIVMGLAGFLGWGLHPDWLVKLLT